MLTIFCFIIGGFFISLKYDILILAWFIMKKLLITTIFFALILGLSACSLKPQAADTRPIFFYSTGCPHCQNVEKFLADNNVRGKYSFLEKEISDDRNNTALMVKYAKVCDLNTDNLGVPMLYSQGKCLSGDVDIINFFKSQLSL